MTERSLKKNESPIVATENSVEGEANNSRLQSFLSSILTSIGGVFGHIQEDQQDEDMTSKETAVLPIRQQPVNGIDIIISFLFLEICFCLSFGFYKYVMCKD